MPSITRGKGDTTVRPVVAAVPALVTALAALAVIWVAPVVGVKNSACEQFPLSSNCR